METTTMTYPVNTIARYILQESGKTSALKLHKLVYYSQAWFLALTKQPLIEEDFEAWVLGPMCPKLYKLHKGKHDLVIEDIPLAKSKNNDLDEDARDIINAVLEIYGPLAGHELSELCHTEDPWKNAWESFLPKKTRSKMLIPKQEMKKYYWNLKLEEEKQNSL